MAHARQQAGKGRLGLVDLADGLVGVGGVVEREARRPADEGLEEWVVPQVWVMGREESDHVIDITDHFPSKLAALKAHDSQVAHLTDLEDRMRTWGLRLAEKGGLPAGRLAEAFTVVDTR